MKNMDMSMETATMVISECKTCVNNESGGPFICLISALLCSKSASHIQYRMVRARQKIASVAFNKTCSRHKRELRIAKGCIVKGFIFLPKASQ